MKSKLSLTLSLLTFVFILTSITNSAFAGELELKMIGAMATQGKTYSEWWYSLTNPTLSGTTADSRPVKITVGTVIYEENANINGDWDILLPLAAGDHNVKIEADGETYSFILHLGQTMPTTTATTTTSTTTSATTTPVPSTGLDQTVAISLAFGLTFLATYLYFFGEKSHIINFEKEIKNH